SFFENRRLDLPLIPKLRIGTKEPMIGSAAGAPFLGHGKLSVCFDQPANGVDLRIREAGGQSKTTDGHTVTSGTFDYFVARLARGIRIVEHPTELPRGKSGVEFRHEIRKRATHAVAV